MNSIFILPDQIVSTLIIVFILGIICIIVGKKASKVDPLKETPKWLVPFVAIVSLVNNFTKENLGKSYRTYAPYILTLGMFLLVSNMSSVFLLVPPTSYLVVNAALALITFLIIQTTAIVKNGLLGHLKDLMGPVWYLSPLMFPINLIGELSLPVSMTLRLLGNIISGAVMSKLAVGAIAAMAHFLFAVPALGALNLIFDITFGAIQALVFVLLTVVFTSMKIPEKDKEVVLN